MHRIWMGAAAFAAVAAATPQANAAVVINELYNGSGNDEWVEFYNNGASPYDISGHTFVRRSNAGTSDEVFYTFPGAFDSGTVVIPPGGYYVIGRIAELTHGTPDATYSGGLIATTNQSFALKKGETVIDGLGTATGSYGAGAGFYAETAPFPGTPETGSSIKRIPNGVDTNNNAVDFQKNNSPTFKANNETVVLPTSVANIAKARAQTVGTEVIITGTVTVVAPTNFTTGRNQIAVQDASGADGASAILVDDPGNVAGATFTVGQTISNLQGTLNVFNGLLQLAPTQPITNIGSGTAPAPLVLTSSVSSIDDIESELITITDASIDTQDTTWQASKNYDLVSPTGLVVSQIRIGSTSPLIGEPIPTGSFTITGIAGEFNGTGQIAPRSTYDIAPPSAVSDWTLY